MRDLIRIFLEAPGSRPVSVLASLVLASLTEGIGIATLLPLLAVVGGGAETASPAARSAIEGFRAFGIEPTVPVLLVVATLAMVAKSGITLLAMRHIGNVSAEVMSELRRRVIERLLRVRWPYLTGQPLGRFTNAVSGEAQRAATAYVQVATLLALFLQTVVFIGVAFLVSWQLALTALALGLLIGLSLHALIGVAKRAGRKQTEHQNRLLVFLGDTLSNLKPIRAMGRGGSFARLLDERVMAVRKSLRRQTIAREGLSSLQDALVAVSFAVIILLVHLFWPVGLPTLMVSGIVLARTAANVGKLQKAYQQAVMVESAYFAMSAMLDELDAIKEPGGKNAAPPLEEGIVFEGVSLQHAGQPTLHGVSLAFLAGELTVLIGPSGAGKTSIVDLVLALHEPSSGRILVDGLPLDGIEREAWRRGIGYVPQELHLLHDTIRHNVTLGDGEIDDEAVKAALDAAGALAFVERLPDGLEATVGEGGAKLSGGQRQRIALARALAKNPRLLILDEATSALDPATGHAIAARVATLKGRMTVIAVTHREEFLDIADRVCRIEAGRIVETFAGGAADGVPDPAALLAARR